ncbi:MAG: FAD-binding dehydrogenase [Bacteriovoracaceae bacterium]|jgi:uncharacterized protein|nr:FAD-binding dehydrogenase [Bacteriovoracaceae bacterium]
MTTKKYSADIVIAGGGLAGIVAAIELLDAGKKVLLVDRDIKDRFGGLAKESFGGVFMVDTPNQKKMGINDSVDLAISDWNSFAEFGPGDDLPKAWAKAYVENCLEYVYHWSGNHGVSFFPVVHWVERGLHQPGNSVPRFHMVWGTGKALIDSSVERLMGHKNAKNLEVLFRHRVDDLIVENQTVAGFRGVDEESEQDFEVIGESTIIATGGVCGSIKKVKENWYGPWGEPPKVILNGSHRYADGKLHDVVKAKGGMVTHMDKYWHYAAGVHHPRPTKENDGLSLVPPKSALWFNYKGERIGPTPLITSFDTRFLVESISLQEQKYSWQVLNQKIAIKEMAVSGAEFNPAIRDKNIVGFLKSILLGNKDLVNDLTTNCEDFVVANSIDELIKKMEEINFGNKINVEKFKHDIQSYDNSIGRGKKLHNDEQLRRIAHVRQYRGDKVRTCKFQKINDPDAYPLIAIREFILSRKTLGGIQTDLRSRVLDQSGSPIKGLYAVGEAAGFGGGGMHGLRALEGTFLGGCIYSAQVAAESITGKKQ